jgi:ribosome-associated heat shock protein Hsp15
MSQADAQRVDKWLWHARFARTRGAAQELVLAGHVRVNREKAKSASKLVRVGDVLTLALGRGVLVLQIRELTERRLSPDRAASLYSLQGASDAGPGAARVVHGPPPPSESDVE